VLILPVFDEKLNRRELARIHDPLVAKPALAVLVTSSSQNLTRNSTAASLLGFMIHKSFFFCFVALRYSAMKSGVIGHQTWRRVEGFRARVEGCVCVCVHEERRQMAPDLESRFRTIFRFEGIKSHFFFLESRFRTILRFEGIEEAPSNTL